MDKSELTSLKELAEAALDAQGDCIWGDFLPAGISTRDRYFITAVQPHVILDFIDEIERLNKNLRHILQTHAKADGLKIPRYDDPEYQPEDIEIDECLYRFEELIKFHKHMCKAYNRLEKEADWLAKRLEVAGAYEEELVFRAKANWRRQARKAVEEECKKP